MQISSEQRRQAFSVWLRTGWLPSPRGRGGLELKFNPWHDPEIGRFTFAGQGRYYGRGGRSQDGVDDRAAGRRVQYVDDPDKPPIRSVAEAGAWRAKELALHGGDPEYSEAVEARYRLYLAALSQIKRAAPASKQASASPKDRIGSNLPQTSEIFTGGGGSFGAGGATGRWVPSTERVKTPLFEEDITGKPAAPRQNTAVTSILPESGRASEDETRRKVSRNGYLFEIDALDRMRRVTGQLRLNQEQKRDKKVQLNAGGGDRRTSDQGGHYIARRFDGPTDAFNHFAQDANFSRSSYLALENRWAKAMQSGSNVRVAIVPVFDGQSERPTSLNVRFWISGSSEFLDLPNEAGRKSDVERGR